MEPEKLKNQHDISIAIIQKDIEYIKQGMMSIQTQIQVLDKHYARHDDVAGVIKAMEVMQKAIDSKVSVTDFEPIKTTLTRINWMLITTILGALLGLVVKTNL